MINNYGEDYSVVPAAATILARCSSDPDAFVPGGTRGFEFIDPGNVIQAKHDHARVNHALLGLVYVFRA